VRAGRTTFNSAAGEGSRPKLLEIRDHLRATDLKPGFVFEGLRIPLVNPQRGIFKPKQMRFLLSIKSVFPKPGAKGSHSTKRSRLYPLFS
jgi:putative restriction endonuclease